jgi:hypothetical protein
MAYGSIIAPAAKEALRACFRSYNQRDPMLAWLKGLVRMAEIDECDRVSMDLGVWLEGLTEMPVPRSDLQLDAPNLEATWMFFRKSGFLKKTQTWVEILKGRRPVQSWYTTQVFSYLTGAIIERVAVYYEVNHVDKKVIFRAFANLPGGDLPALPET